MGNNSKYTVSEALKMIDGIHKKRFYEMMNNGEISYQTEEWGTKQRRVIEASELVRVFGSNFKIETKQEEVSKQEKKQLSPTETTNRNEVLEHEIKLLREQLEYERQERERERNDFSEREKYFRSQNEKLTDTLSKQTLMLEDMRNKTPQKPVEKPKGFFSRLV